MIGILENLQIIHTTFEGASKSDSFEQNFYPIMTILGYCWIFGYFRIFVRDTGILVKILTKHFPIVFLFALSVFAFEDMNRDICFHI